MVGVLAMCVPVIEKAELVVEPLLVRLPGRTLHAEAPFADDGCAVACVAQQHRHRDVFRSQWDLAVAANPSVAGVLARHQCGPRGRAHGAAGIVVGETDPLLRQAIDTRRREPGLPVGAQIAIPEIVGLDEDDVGRGLTLRKRRGREL